jgi:serine phosphatase RsbU (regulator of sigma subunit)
VPIPEDEFERTIIGGHARPPEPRADAVGHYLIIEKEGEPEGRVEIGREPITIGRDARRTIVLTEAGVSRLHAQVSLIDDAAIVDDPGSTNGTFIDGERVLRPTPLRDGSVLRIGSHLIKYERRSRAAVARERELDHEIRQARDYVFSLLPAPIDDGPVRTDWRFVPSRQLGGDAFGYYWLDPESFVFYLLDVSGHGVAAAMHSVTVLNVLRQRALPNVDFANPAAVLTSLNNRFQMDSHHGMFLTIWYGVYHTADRTLTYGSAGHHAARLVSADRKAAQPIGAPALMIGALPDISYDVGHAAIPPGASIYLFSDGVFENMTASGERWTEAEFVRLLPAPPVPELTESERLYQGVKAVTGHRPLDDDASLLVVRFP